MSVIVFVDSKDGKLNKAAFEATSYGSKIGGGSSVVVTYGNADAGVLAELGNYGASKVLVARSVNTADPQQITRIITQVVESEGANVVVFTQDTIGKAIAPRVSARLDAGHVPGAIEYPNTDGGFSVKVNVFSGKAFADIEIKTDKKIISLLPNSVAPETTGGSASVEDLNVDAGSAGLTVKEVKSKGGDIALPEAELVVSAGRGLKGPENWEMVENLAKSLGAATACSRPVADMDWRPHHEHVGQTGVAIRPNLYIAAGISGAIQHLAGVNGSKVIVVINTDSEAPFFKAADYGIIGDAFEVLPKLTEAINNLKSQ